MVITKIIYCVKMGITMDEFKKYIRTNKSLVELIILAAGIILIVFGESLHVNVLTGIGSSVLASALVVFVTDALLGTESDEKLKTWGLVDLYSTRSEMNKSCDRYLQNAKEVSIIAFGLRSLRETQRKVILQILRRGGSIRILTMKPGCEYLNAREKEEFRVPGSISAEIEQLIDWAKELNSKGYSGKVEIKYHEHLPLDFMFLMDNRLFTGPYEYGKSSQQSISYEYTSYGTAYKYYKEYFNGLWEDMNFGQDALS